MTEMLPTELGMVSASEVRPLRRAEYARLVDAGCFEGERVELLFGMVVEMPPANPPHDTGVMAAGTRLIQLIGDRARVRIQCSFIASDLSVPLPDVVVAPLPESWTDHPDHALLIVEVARSSLDRDRGPKRLLYANGCADEYWVVNHHAERVEVYRDALDGEWTRCTHHHRGDTVHMLAFPDIELAVADLLPPS